MIYFICGCASKIAPPITREIFKTFDSVVEDQYGHLVCIVHHERLKGWRSVPYSANTMLPGAQASWTPLEYERWRIFGEYPRVKKYAFANSAAEDRRDARDPQEVGMAILAKRNGG